MSKTHAATLTDARAAMVQRRIYIVLAWCAWVLGALIFVSTIIAVQTGALYPSGYVFVGGAVLLIFGGLSAAAYKAASTYRQRADDLRAQALNDIVFSDRGDVTPEPFILYLRPFVSMAGVTTKAPELTENSDPLELETQLAFAARKYCQFVALGRSLEHDGAGRIEVEDSDWQRTALRLMDLARVIVLIPSTNAGTMWEIEQILRNGWVPKTLIVNVPEKSGWFSRNAYTQQEDWPTIDARFVEDGFRMPPYLKTGQIIFFGSQPEFAQEIDPLEFHDIGHLRGVLRRTRLLDRR